ncbi:MAG: sulfate reduction electron transfer complex DsrMKJOP subunit DsrM [bacterium]|nr:sulfate reduction electron transfer complex DsrMKJOP subunit DsrM [bacterium]
MRILIPLVATLILAAIAYGGAQAGLYGIFGVAIPYLAFVVFVLGFSYKIIAWAKVPVPFAIQTTCGQGKSLDWIKNNELEAPSSRLGVVLRMALEVLLFRSLFRNTMATLQTKEGEATPELTYESDKSLWLFGLIFHWSFLLIFLRHYRFFLEPVPFFVPALEAIDGMMQITLPAFYLTDLLILLGVTALFVRRVISPKMRFLSLPADYFPLILIGAIALTGMGMRYHAKVDIAKVKTHIQGLMTFNPGATDMQIGAIFYVHLFLVCVLAMYFPFSKLMHMGGVFFSPTRNMRNDSRARRHINPWNPEIKIRTYAAYEDDFRDKMRAAGLPLDKE